MKKSSRVSILFVLLPILTVHAQQLDSTVATVKLTRTQAISATTLKKEIARYDKAWTAEGKTLTDDERSGILNRMIDIILFKQAAERDHVQVSDAQLDVVVQRARQTLSLQRGRDVTEEDVRAQIAAEGLGWDAWLDQQRDLLLPQVYVAQMKAKEMAGIPAPSAADIRYYYESNLTQFTVGSLIEFKHIFVDLRGKDPAARQEAQARINGLAQRISKGEAFEEVAMSSSDDKETKDRGGYSGFLQLDQAQARALGKDFVVAVLALKEGQISGVIQSTVGFHIVKVVRIIPAKLYGLDEKFPPYYQQTVSDRIRTTLLSLSQQQALEGVVESTRQTLRAAAEIHVEEKNLGFRLKK